MCGIGGIIQFDGSPINLNALKGMSESLRDRGPDDIGFLGGWKNSSVRLSRNCETIEGSSIGLLHRRLSILDRTVAGWQPMGSSDYRYYIIFNGEIYNYIELKTKLQALGYKFHSGSDTEVLLYAYAHWGTRALTKLAGMFAFTILDTKQRQLFLARDFFGIKPLYYTYLDNGFAFASEIKTLLEIPNLRRQINPKRLYDYLYSGLTDYGNETLFAQIQQLPASHYLEIPLDAFTKTEPQQYWQINLNQSPLLSYDEASSELRELFLGNVQQHMRSDVPIGAALSGGIDSSAIVMAMRYLQGQDIQLHTFSYVSNDLHISEEKWIDVVSNSSACLVNKVSTKPEELLTDVEQLIYHQDIPFGSTSIYAQYRVFQLAQNQGIKVMLDGQGADEILGGYKPYLATRLASLIRQGKWLQANYFLQKVSRKSDISHLSFLIRAAGLLLPPSLQGIARKLVGKEVTPSWLNNHWFQENGFSFSFSQPTEKLEEILRETLYYACTKTSLPMLLRYEDRNSMAHSIESRVPFLTPNLVNFMFSLPEEFIINPEGTSKAVFREAMQGILPDEILNRQDKIGFATPEQSWLRQLQPWIESTLNSEVAQEIPALNLSVVKKEANEMLEGKQHFDFRLWRWVNLIRWTEQFSVSFEE